MNNLLKITRMVVRITGLIQIVLGLLFWAGKARTLIPAHILCGTILVLGLWLIAILAGRSGARLGMVILALVWGLITIGLGMSQARILLGPAHWVIDAVHLLVGIGAVGLAEMLGVKKTSTPAPAPSAG